MTSGRPQDYDGPLRHDHAQNLPCKRAVIADVPRPRTPFNFAEVDV